jgi:basic amino acid/polyamine antiporter, APA family
VAVAATIRNVDPQRIEPSGSTSGTPTLLRQLGVVSATALVVSNMVGTGIFAFTGYLAGDLGSPKLILLIWLTGALCALAGAFCYSELGVNFPSSGGEYVYLTRAFGPTWGFMTGWVSLVAGFSAPIAASALAFADYLGYFFPVMKQNAAIFTYGSGDWTFRFGGAQVVASTLVAAFTVMNFFGVRRVARVQNALTGAKLTMLILFIGLALLVGKGDWKHFSMPTTRWTTNSLHAQFAISLFWIYLAYSGWNAATYIADELKQPSKTLPRALACGTALVAALFIALNVVFMYAVPLETIKHQAMKGDVAVGSLAASHLFGPGVAGGFSALMALALMSTVNAMVTIGPRLYYAMAQNGAFFAGAAKVSPRWHTPVNAIVWQGLCAVLMTLTPFPVLVNYIGFLLNFFAVVAVTSLLIFRRGQHWEKLRVVSFAYPLIPAVFLLVGGWITIRVSASSQSFPLARLSP